MLFITSIGEEGSEVRCHADDMLTLLESAMSKLEKYKVSVIRSDLKVDVIDGRSSCDCDRPSRCEGRHGRDQGESPWTNRFLDRK